MKLVFVKIIKKIMNEIKKYINLYCQKSINRLKFLDLISYNYYKK